MNSGPTAERVHEVLKRRIMGREFRPGDRLDPAVLAAPLSHGSGLYGLPHVQRAAVNVVPESGGFEPEEIVG